MGQAKKRKKSVAKHQDIDNVVPEHLDFHSNEARSGYRVILRKNKILERGIVSEPPFDEYIRRHSWEILCKSPGDANITMACEFYANMKYMTEDGHVLCRGKQVRVNPEIINDYYQLRSKPEFYEDYDRLVKEAGQDKDGNLVGIWPEVVREITQDRYLMEEILPRKQWGSIHKKYLTTEMNVWYSFVAHRLSPVTVNSQVQWERIRILYALKKHMPINVGGLIFTSMCSMVTSSSGWGLMSLVTGLCQRAGCEARMDDMWKEPMAMLKLDSFLSRVPRPSSEEPLTAEQGRNKDYVDDGQDPDLRQRVRMMEADIATIRRRCEHIDAVLAHAFPDSVAAVGPFKDSGGAGSSAGMNNPAVDEETKQVVNDPVDDVTHDPVCNEEPNRSLIN